MTPYSAEVIAAMAPPEMLRAFRLIMGNAKAYDSRIRVIGTLLLGRPMRPDEEAHHKDGNRRNNVPSNIEPLTRLEHRRRHDVMPLRNPIPRVDVVPPGARSAP